VRWPAAVTAGTVSDALFSQVDMLASFASLTQQLLAADEATDSFDMLGVLLGKSKKGRPYIVEQANALSVIRDHWKYIEPKAGPVKNQNVNIELGNNLQPQLYDLSKDTGEKDNLAAKKPALVKELSVLLETIRQSNNERKRN
jgi:arylsulfatase A-like enzyme